MKTIILMAMALLAACAATADDGLSDEVAAARDYLETHPSKGNQKPFSCVWTPIPGGSCTCCSNAGQTCCSCPTSDGCF